jgi:hypothetical protein
MEYESTFDLAVVVGDAGTQLLHSFLDGLLGDVFFEFEASDGDGLH